MVTATTAKCVLHQFIDVLLVLMTLSVLAARFVRPLQGFLLYGKAKDHRPDPGQNIRSQIQSQGWPLVGWIQNFYVPKSYFIHFYALSVTATTLLLASVTVSQVSAPVQSLLLGTLVLIHSMNRLLDSLTSKPSVARIHIFHYIVGLVFYTLISCILYLALYPETTASPKAPAPVIAISVILLLYASYSQHCYHLHLQSLPKYSLPTYKLFSVVSSPHYFCEVLVYLALLILYIDSPWLPVCHRDLRTTLGLALIWVITNLGISAEVTHRYYLDKFKSAPKYMMIPFVY